MSDPVAFRAVCDFFKGMLILRLCRSFDCGVFAGAVPGRRLWCAFEIPFSLWLSRCDLVLRPTRLVCFSQRSCLSRPICDEASIACVLLRPNAPARCNWTLLRFGKCLIRFDGEERVQRMWKQMAYAQEGQHACPTPPYVILWFCAWAWWNVMAVKWKVRLQSWVIRQTMGCGQTQTIGVFALSLQLSFWEVAWCVNQSRFVFELSRDWRQGAATCRTARFIQ